MTAPDDGFAASQGACLRQRIADAEAYRWMTDEERRQHTAWVTVQGSLTHPHRLTFDDIDDPGVAESIRDHLREAMALAAMQAREIEDRALERARDGRMP